MFRKLLHNKKGFTLVELMIVVVIMGILVAVAIPVYGAVTGNTEKKTCHSNCEIIQKAINQYFMNGDGTLDYSKITNGAATLTIASQAEAESKLPAEFLACFEDSQFPQCPSNGFSYTFVYVAPSGNDDIGSCTVYCSEHGDKLGNAQP